MKVWVSNSHLIVTTALVAYVGALSCSRAGWDLSFDKEGISSCPGNRYIQGFDRSDNGGNYDAITRLEGAQCCDIPYKWYWNDTMVQQADWWTYFDHDRTWSVCPSGYFLNGLYRTGGDSMLHNIEEGRCIKPAEHPNYYGDCYDENIGTCFDKFGLCKCRDNYYAVGLHRGDCNQLHCLDYIKCCTLADGPETLDTIDKVKSHIMDVSLRNMAVLAHYLGYGWCGGCRTPWIGEGFDKQDYEWRASTKGPCSGYMSDQRLSIEFGDWSWGIKDMTYGQPIIEDLQPETVDTGLAVNNDPVPLEKEVKRTTETVRSVTHSTTDEWKQSHELGVEVSYSPGEAGGFGFSASYKFGYEKSSSTTDSTQNDQKKSFEVSTKKTIAPYSSSKWKLILHKSRTTVPYTATIIVRFSAKFKGFLRWGGGYSGDSTNYHVSHRGSGDRPNVPYKFGDAQTPFYQALKQQAKTNASPWMWYDMKNQYPDVQGIIDSMTNEDKYVFVLRGKFEDTMGTKVDVIWDAVNSTSGKRSPEEEAEEDSARQAVKTVIAKPGPNDPPAPNPEPPMILLNKHRHVVLPSIPVDGGVEQ